MVGFSYLNLASTNHKSKRSFLRDAASPSPLARSACGKRRRWSTNANQLSAESAASPNNYFRLAGGGETWSNIYSTSSAEENSRKVEKTSASTSIRSLKGRLIDFGSRETTLKATVVGWKGNSWSATRVIHSEDSAGRQFAGGLENFSLLLSWRCGRYRPGLLRLSPPHSFLWADQLCSHH